MMNSRESYSWGIIVVAIVNVIVIVMIAVAIVNVTMMINAVSGNFL
jgi:hypothetical protein